MPDSSVEPKADALAKRTEPVEEIIPDGLGGERAITRATDGKFQRRITTAMQKSMKDSARFLEGTDEETGMVRADAIRQTIFENILNAGPKDAMGAVKGAQFLENSAFGKSKETLVDNRQDNSIKIVFIPMPLLNTPTVTAEEARAPRPTQPTFAEVLSATVNPPDSTAHLRQHGDKPKPELEPTGDKVADAIAAKQQRFDRTKARY